MNNRINKTHEKALRLGSKDETDLSFDDLLKNHKSISVHQRNLQTLVTEICEVK